MMVGVVFQIVVPRKKVLGVSVVVECVLGYTFVSVKVGEVIGQARLAGTVISEHQCAVGELVAVINLEASAEGLYYDIRPGLYHPTRQAGRNLLLLFYRGWNIERHIKESLRCDIHPVKSGAVICNTL